MTDQAGTAMPAGPATTANGDGNAVQPAAPSRGLRSLNSGLRLLQVAIALALFLVGAVVLVRTIVDFLDHPGTYPESIVNALDGILVTIIIVDLLHTVVTHLHDTAFPVRPFLVVGILAGVRDVLSASARLTLTRTAAATSFNQSIIELGVGVGVVVILLTGLVVLRWTHTQGVPDEDD